MKPKYDVPTAPSFYLDSAIKDLRLDGTLEEARIKNMARKADAFHMKHCPGRPNITMAAFLSDALPIRNTQHNFTIRRTTKEITKAFDCSESSMRERKTLIKTERR